MANYDDRLSGYVFVRDRLRLALEKYPDLHVTEKTPIFQEVNGATIILCEVIVGRTPDDPHPINAHATEPYPGKTPYTRDSEVANGMTSALGRALGYLGFGIDKSIASADDVQNRSGAPSEKQPPAKQQQPRAHDEREIPRPASPPQKKLISDLRVGLGLPAQPQGYYDALTAAGAHKEIDRLKALQRGEEGDE